MSLYPTPSSRESTGKKWCEFWILLDLLIQCILCFVYLIPKWRIPSGWVYQAKWLQMCPKMVLPKQTSFGIFLLRWLWLTVVQMWLGDNGDRTWRERRFPRIWYHEKVFMKQGRGNSIVYHWSQISEWGPEPDCWGQFLVWPALPECLSAVEAPLFSIISSVNPRSVMRVCSFRIAPRRYSMVVSWCQAPGKCLPSCVRSVGPVAHQGLPHWSFPWGLPNTMLKTALSP